MAKSTKSKLKSPKSPPTRRVIDVLVHDHGSIFLFSLLTPAAQEWVAENVETESHNWLGGSLAVEHRYAHALAAGMIDAGLNVR